MLTERGSKIVRGVAGSIAAGGLGLSVYGFVNGLSARNQQWSSTATTERQIAKTLPSHARDSINSKLQGVDNQLNSWNGYAVGTTLSSVLNREETMLTPGEWTDFSNASQQLAAGYDSVDVGLASIMGAAASITTAYLAAESVISNKLKRQ